MQGVRDTFTHWWLVVRCSLIGVVLGVIPGVGGGLSQWLAYGHAVQSSKDPNRFGKGAVEGVLGPGASNNSKEGGHLIPTVAFGVPGSAAMAILLAAFVIMGIQPGPNMLTRNLDLTFFLVWVLVAANLIGVALSFLFLNQLAKITFVRGTLLVPFITLLIFLAHDRPGQVGDLVVTLFFGALAWTMHKLGWPVVPLILGLVLGDRAENSLWISSRIFGFSWLGRPIVIALIIVAVAAIIFTLTKMRRGVQIDAVEDPPNLRIARLGFSVAVFATAVAAVVASLDLPVAARLFPIAIGSVTAVAVFFQVIFDMLNLISGRKQPAYPEPAEKAEASRVERRRTVEIFGWMLGLFAAIWAVGFTFLVAPFILLYLKLSAQEKWKTALIAAGVTGLIYWVFFDMFLNVSTPSGALIPW